MGNFILLRLTVLSAFVVGIGLVWGPDFAVAAPAPKVAQPESLNILVHGDPQAFEPYLVGREVKRISEQFGDNIIVIHARNADEFKTELKRVAKLGLTVRSLTFRGIHGGNYDQIPYFEVADYKNDDFESVGVEDLADLDVQFKTDDKTVIFFDSCSMVDDSSGKALRRSFQEFDQIGLDHGRFYMNKTNGSNAVENVFTVPFYEQTGDWIRQARQALFQAGWPITLGIYYYMDQFKLNQGYLRDRRGGKELYTATHASSALKLK